MKNNILLVERMILESLFQLPKNYYELELDTGLDPMIIKNITDNFILRGYVLLFSGKFVINKMNADIIKLVSKKENDQLPDAIKEMFVGLVNHYFSQNRDNVLFKLQKLEVTEAENIMLENLFQKIGIVVEQIKSRKKQGLPLKQHKVLFWGSGDYKTLVKGSMAI